MKVPFRGEGRVGGPRRLASVAGLLALSLLSLAASGCAKFESRQKIREGNAYFKEGLFEDALKKYKEAQSLDPEEVRLDKFVAMGYMATYNPGSTHEKDVAAVENAITHFKKYLAAKPDDEKAAKYLVTTYMNAQRYDDAIGYFVDWVQKHPQDAQAVQTVAMLYAKKGDYEKSMEWQEKRTVLEPGNAEVWYTMGVTCWDKSYNTVREALTDDERRKILDKGMEALKKANDLKQDYFEAQLYINLLLREYAKIEADEQKVAELKAQADEWQKKALEARRRAVQKEREEAAARNPLEAM